MTTTAHTRPAHGTTARGYGSPGRHPRCHCTPCRKARNRHQKQLRLNHELGRSPFTDPAKAQAHLRELHQTMGWDTLAAATGIWFSNLVQIYNGQRTKIRHETEAKILAVAIPTKGDPGQYIDATGSTRRLQALACAGHSYAAICQAAGTCTNRVISIANGRQPTIRRDLADRIAAAYERLAFNPAPKNKHTTRTRNVARAKGWRDPQWWEDYGHIDDPAFDPEAADRVLNFHERAKLRREEIEHLAWCGDSPEQIFTRLGGEVSISTVRQIVQEWRTGVKRDRKQAAA
ncbi:hypothetical protein [Streptomyces odontomachi]|uniref:hypothetical protein n=1 Tax=Streptomyces odontomachi TaxID=2944940 RepID=UPI00210E955C|nr:hypothetical protein [Streptomyces sp. ODS25]